MPQEEAQRLDAVDRPLFQAAKRRGQQRPDIEGVPEVAQGPREPAIAAMLEVLAGAEPQ